MNAKIAALDVRRLLSLPRSLTLHLWTSFLQATAGPSLVPQLSRVGPVPPLPAAVPGQCASTLTDRHEA
jgi:hypothetical protein